MMTAKNSRWAGGGFTTATARTIMGFAHDGGGRAEQIAQRLSRAIQVGLISDGARLPTEVTLAEQLGVATVTLREALAVLRGQGLVVTKRGRDGGTFVRSPVDHVAGGLVERLRSLSIQEFRELGDHRCAISGTAAALAAQRALPEDTQDLRAQVERLRTAGTAQERRRADAQISLQIASAAQSSRLTREESRLQAEIGDLLWMDVTDADHQEWVTRRLAVVEAIVRGEAHAARVAVERQIAQDTARLVRIRLDLYRSASASAPARATTSTSQTSAPAGL